MKIIIIAAVLFLFSSCSSTIDFKVRGNRFHTPESSGGSLKGHGSLGVGRSLEYQLAKISGSDLFGKQSSSITTNQYIYDSEALSFDTALGINDQFDIFYNASYDSPDLLGVKYQLLGPTKKDEEGHKMAVELAYGTMTEEKDRFGVNDNSSTKLYNAELKVKAYEVSLIYGIRHTRNFLVYINYTHSINNAVAQLSGVGVADERVSGYVRTNSILTGFNLSMDKNYFGIIGEIGYTKGKWQSNYSRSDIPLGLRAYFAW